MPMSYLVFSCEGGLKRAGSLCIFEFASVDTDWAMIPSMRPRLPDPRVKYPLQLPNGDPLRSQVFLSNVLDHPNIEVGDYSYYHDDRPIENYASTLAPYLFPFSKEKLIIGSFCQIAQGVQFITASANHDMEGFSTYPFASFDSKVVMEYLASKTPGPDTRIGHDCWLGRDAMFLPGAQLGSGVIVGARAVVAGKVPDYAVVAGNPAQIIRMRYSDSEIERLLALQWWNWPAASIEAAIPMLLGDDLGGLETLAPPSA